MHFKPISLPFSDLPPLLVRVTKRPLQITGVRVIDLARAGCIIDWHAWTMREKQPVLIGLPSLADIPARVLWVETGIVGLRFDNSLSQAAHERLVSSFRIN